MKNIQTYFFIALLIFFAAASGFGQGIDKSGPVNDGPYIFNDGGKFNVKWISNNKLIQEPLDSENFHLLKDRFKLLFSYDYLNSYFVKAPDFAQNFHDVDSICILSDAHGEYEVYIKLLKSMGVIDDELNWSFGAGHLVLLGDVFDRGDKVTEVLWHLYGLEQQAITAGGMVHYILGNHELMILENDLSYIHPKYNAVENISGVSYSGLFSETSVLGNWMRSRPVAIRINDMIFAHGGISIDLIYRELTLRRINRMFYEDIVGKKIIQNNSKMDQNFLSFNSGPIWYRGYFTDTTFTEARADSILNYFDANHLVVGHTTFNDIRSKYNKKIIGVDAGIGYDLPGRVLFYKNGTFYKGYPNGKRLKF